MCIGSFIQSYTLQQMLYTNKNNTQDTHIYMISEMVMIVLI